MSPKKVYSFMIEPDLADALKVLKERDGIPEGEQIRRALTEWFRAKGVIKKAASRRVSPRRKA